MRKETNQSLRKFSRRKFGVLLAVLAPVVFVVLASGDVQLVTISSRHFDATGATLHSLNLHWPLILPSSLFIAGILLALLPGRKGRIRAETIC
jgi:hypothetical protein